MSGGRFDRKHGDQKKAGDHRTVAQIDRDRILYSDEFRRLAGVTQVVGALEGHIFHNRLTHSLKTAQLARRLTEYLDEHNSDLAEHYKLNPDVAEAAGLAHDLGHPPFGHVAEEELDKLARGVTGGGDPDGFEGNAQSFRVLTRLAAHRSGYKGLDLSRATLDAVLKYPWFRELHDEDSHKHEKFGAYRDNDTIANWVRQNTDDVRSDEKSPEAAIMDHADDIAYSVHDLDDFCRAGLIPVARLTHSEYEWSSFLEEWASTTDVDFEELEDRSDQLRSLLDMMYTDEPYVGKFHQRATLKTSGSNLIQQFLTATELKEPDEEGILSVDPDRDIEMQFLQQLVEQYVIHNASLRTQQRGQRKIIRQLFEIYLEAVADKDTDIIPGQYRYDLERIVNDKDQQTKDENGNPTRETVRLAVDIVSGFTDQQAILMYRRLTGVDSGSVGEFLPVN